MQLINSSRKKTRTKQHKNREMNSDTYKLRREVMSLIYEAKKLLNGNMPRVTIRITDCEDRSVLGTARMGDCVIWIPATTLNSKYLREVVFHELCHAIWATPHKDNCHLMRPMVKNRALSKKKVHEIFLQYAQKNNFIN